MAILNQGGDDNEMRYDEEERKSTPDAREATGLNIFSMFKDRQRFLTLSEEGEKFISTLKKLNEEAGTKFEFVSAKTSAIDAIMVKTYDGKFGLIIGFAETATKNAEVPCIQHLSQASEQAERSGIKLLSPIIVGKEDYAKPTNMFQNICNIVDVATDNPSIKLSIKDFKKNDIYVSTSLLEAKEILTKMYPHKVLPRMDVAAVFKLQDMRDRDNTAVIAVVTGYTDFIGMTVKSSYSAHKPRFSPMFHMEVHSDIADPVLAALVLPATIDIFCIKHQWLRVYDNYKEDMINLGSLIPASTASPVPFRAKDRNERDEFIEKYVDPVPNPVLDVFIGKAQLPLAKYLSGDTEGVKKFIKRLAGFLGVDPADIPSPIEINVADVINFAGIIDVDGNLMDSRNVDYLHITSKTNNCDRALSFLNYFENPADRAKLIADTYPDYENRFAFAVKQIDFEFINFMADTLAAKRINFVYETRYDSMFSGGIYDVDTIRRNTSQIHISGLEKSFNRGTGFNFRAF